MQELGSLLFWLDIAGLSVFAVSGVLVAVRKRVDFVGACFFALVTAVGGGTLRDLLIDAPVFWMNDPSPVVLCVVIAIAAWLVPLRWWPERAFEWLDAAGLAAYSVYGASKALQFGVAPISAVAAGVITACVGGVIRDVTVGVPSILMRHELYVTAALVAALAFVGMGWIGIAAPWPAVMGVIAGFALRGAAIRWKLALPPHRGN
ncbi:putative membrane protein [Lysobacter dokdonensis DS-58]|uniref:Putative membrane protein n=1 Tax=Lysobacter dokdonensis DS-58 TaxID=1300345 RepID=A0A0A2WHI3_9GAMM|nr:trimeric intracellular cation channel family protein [Lysobacter dokdonensis]KGQ19258.1 putative membrane protein [Lysobacter dokdonensis DS-58]